MTVSTSSNKITYLTDGIAAAYSLPYKCLAPEDVKVYIDDEPVVSGFTTVLASDLSSATVTFAPILAVDLNLTLVRDVAILQTTNLGVTNTLSEPTLEKMYDKLTMICQQLKDSVNRTISLPISSIVSGLAFPNPVANKLLAWNADGTAIINSDGTPGPEGPAGEMTGPLTSVIGNIPVFADLIGNSVSDSGSSIASVVASAEAPADLALNGFRLSLHATNPYLNSVTGSLSIYSHPYKGNKISLWDSAASKMTAKTSGILTETITAATHYFRPAFIYEYLNAGVPDLEIDWWAAVSSKAITLLTIANPCVITCTAHGWSIGDKIGIRRGTAAGTAWTDTDKGLDQKEFYISATTTNTVTLEGCDTSALAVTNYTGATAYKIPATPTTGVARTEGVWFKSGDRTRRLVGAAKTNGAGAFDCNYGTRLNLCNVDNLEPMCGQAVDGNASWTSVAVATTQPRSGTLELGKSRLEFMLALPQYVQFFNEDHCLSAGGAAGIQLNRVASEAMGAFTVTKCYSNLGYASGYPNAGSSLENPALAAGSHFVQRIALGSGLSFIGRLTNTNGGADSFLDMKFMG